MVDLDDLVVAYRKAKVDLFLASDQRLLDLADYEESLEANLQRLLERIGSGKHAWIRDPAFTGTFTLTPKSVASPETQASRWSSPEVDWRRRTEFNRPIAQFRVMAKCSIDFHVFSTLWIQKVGTYLDKRLSDTAYGSRLRRGPFGGPNTLGLGSFKQYYTPYKAWRDHGIAAIRDALAEGTSVVALTADATSFYHGLSASFLRDTTYLRSVLGAQLDSEQRHLNELFVAALQAWADQFADHGWSTHGLPVGLPASAVVANLALADLDKIAGAASAAVLRTLRRRHPSRA